MSSQSTTPGERAFRVYISNAGDGTIKVFEMHSAFAAPAELQTVAIAEGVVGAGPSTPMALAPGGRRLYCAVRAAPLPVTGFAIDPDDGRLTALGSGRLPASTPYIATDRTGRFLFSAANIGATLAVSAIDGEGRIAPRAHQVLHIGHKLHCIAVDAGNRNVYVSSTDDGVIHHFVFDADRGFLAPAEPPTVALKAGGDPRHMAFSPDGRFMYVTTEAGGHVACLAVDAASGGLAERADIAMMPPDFTGRPMTADLHLTGDGRFLYASERVLNRVVAYRVERQSGALAQIGAVTIEGWPRAFAVAPDDSLLLVAGQNTDIVSAYAIDPESGGLTEGVRFACGPVPNWIEIAQPSPA